MNILYLVCRRGGSPSAAVLHELRSFNVPHVHTKWGPGCVLDPGFVQLHPTWRPTSQWKHIVLSTVPMFKGKRIEICVHTHIVRMWGEKVVSYRNKRNFRCLRMWRWDSDNVAGWEKSAHTRHKNRTPDSAVLSIESWPRSWLIFQVEWEQMSRVLRRWNVSHVAQMWMCCVSLPF